MNWMGGLSLFAAAACLVAGWVVIRANPRFLGNWVAGFMAFAGTVWSIGIALIDAAQDDSMFWWGVRIGEWGHQLITPLGILLTGLVFLVRGWKLWLLVGLYSAYTLVALYFVNTGVWVVSGYHPGPWGNVIELSTDSPGAALSGWFGLLNFLIGVGLAVRAWRQNHSRRYRALMVRFMGLAFGLQLIIHLLDAWLWKTLDFPEMSIVAILLYLLLFLFLFTRPEEPQDLLEPLFGHLDDLVLLVDGGGRVLRVSPRLLALLGPLGKGAKGRTLGEILPGWPGLPSLWSRIQQVPLPVVKQLGTLGSGQFHLDLTPSVDRYGDVAGAVVRLTGQQTWDHAFQQYGISTRESEVCVLLLEGFDTTQIAEALFISPGTVKNHVQSVLRKTNAKNRVELVSLLRAAEGCD